VIITDELELSLDGIAQGGDGVGRHEGMVVFARGGLPGERVRLHLNERKASYARGAVLEVLEPSPDRIAPVLAAGDHAPWQHIAYPAQLRFKETILREQLERLGGVRDLPLAPIIAAPRPWGYRNTARLHVAGVKVGYHAAGSREVVPISADPLLLPVLNEALAGLRGLLIPGLLTEITLRASATFGYSLALLQAAPGASGADLELLAVAWQAHVPTLAGVAVIGPEGRWDGAAAGAATLHEDLAGIRFSLDPASFFQVNLGQAERMVALAQAALEPAPGRRLLDLYSGAGAFALPLAAAGAELTAVEEHRGAIADGKRSAELNDLAGLRFVRAPVERALPALDGPFDGVLLDPPRRGCHPAVIEELARLRAPRLVYISCHPAILSRDLPPLLRAGYRLDSLQPIDLFPQTPHIETVAVLSRV
jgi:23S rRNA (uracil1939-C5)-methyltransferase